MSLVSQLIRLRGPATQTTVPPPVCATCGCKHLYVQTDFNRTLGLWLVGLASILTVVFAIYGTSWFVTWSPMVAFLVVDRLFAWTSPPVVICYQCEHLYRGLTHEQVKAVPAFDLDLHDRLLYAERTADTPKS